MEAPCCVSKNETSKGEKCGFIKDVNVWWAIILKKGQS